MLDPAFFRIPPSIALGPTEHFKVTGYTLASGYTLVGWSIADDADGDEYQTGETLYGPGGSEVTSSAGRIDFARHKNYRGISAGAMPDLSAVGEHVPPLIAEKLRDTSAPGVVKVSFALVPRQAPR